MPLSSQEISDRIEINDLLVRYCTAIDTQDWSLLDSCFLPDATLDYTQTGGIAGKYPEVRAWLEKVLAIFSVTVHFIGNSTVKLDGDRASSRTYTINPMGIERQDGSTHIFTVGGTYVDELTRTAEGWRIARRTEESAYVDGSPSVGLQPTGSS